MPAAHALLRVGSGRDPAWLNEARSLIRDRPSAWADFKSKTEGKLHPAELFRALKPYVERDPDTVLICDGGEFAQWGQAILSNDRRMINGVAGSIGSSLPMAGGSRVVERTAPVFAVLGDGTFGFHMSEFETAVRLNLPYVAVVGTDCRWNAEYNLQVRDYGPNRTFGCELDPTRYDMAVAAMGGHGELVTQIERCGRRGRTRPGQRQARLHQRNDRKHPLAGRARDLTTRPPPVKTGGRGVAARRHRILPSLMPSRAPWYGARRPDRRPTAPENLPRLVTSGANT